MSYKDREQNASFRGVPFLTEAKNTEVGRRVQVDSYPFKDSTQTEDLGRLKRKYTLTAYVIGDDHDLQRDKLIAALETKGPGELVHPDYGRQTVVAELNTVSSDIKQRITTFTLNFHQAGDISQQALTQSNIPAKRNDAYQATKAALTQHFAANLGDNS